MRTGWFFWSLLGVVTLSSCAGSAPDFSQRTAAPIEKQKELASWLVQDANRSSIAQINAPVCSSAVGHPATGWAIEDNNWCVVSCKETPSEKTLNQWTANQDGLRCFVTDQAEKAYVSAEYQPNHWQLDQQRLFTGFDRSFISDTEWSCIEQDYQIDPKTRRGFWIDVARGNAYRFYQDGALMIARAGLPMKFAGDWRGKSSSGVIVNDREIFRYSVNYGAGRFDEYRSATSKQLCRFKDEAGPRA